MDANAILRLDKKSGRIARLTLSHDADDYDGTRAQFNFMVEMPEDMKRQSRAQVEALLPMLGLDVTDEQLAEALEQDVFVDATILNWN